MADSDRSELKDGSSKNNLIVWMANNHVAANILMLALVIGGLLSLTSLRQEVFPSYAIDSIRITMSYPGASPEEVEEGIVLAMESELRPLAGVKQVNAVAGEGTALVIVDLMDGMDANRMLQDVRGAIDRVTSFPEDAEPPRIELRARERSVMRIGVVADLPEASLFELSERIRNDLQVWDGVTRVEVRGARRPEISIEIPQETLRGLSLTLPEVAGAVRSAARDVPGGGLDTSQGEFLLRTEGRKERGLEFENVPLKTADDGSKVLLGDVANIIDGFEEGQSFFRYNGKPGLELSIYQAENYSPPELVDEVRAYIERLDAGLPDSVLIAVTTDMSQIFRDRIGTLLRNGLGGLALVVIALGLFLNIRLAFWVSVSIPVVFIGSAIFMSVLDVSINMVSTFAIIVTLGIVVDDAIIVGENIFAKAQAGLPVRQAVAEGAQEMLLPVIFAVVTNMLAFIPIIYMPGETGQMFAVLGIVACIVFFVSLVEALLILPSHLNGKEGSLTSKPPAERKGFAALRRVQTFQQAAAASLDRFRDGPYLSALNWSLRNPVIVFVMFLGVLIFNAAWYQSGRMELQWNPEIPSDRVDADIEMPTDASFDHVLEIALKVEAAGMRALERVGSRDDLLGWTVETGRHGYSQAEVEFSLVPEDERSFETEELTRVWREEIGPLPEVRRLSFDFVTGPGAGKALRFALSHSSNAVLEEAARKLAEEMETYAGVHDVSDGTAEGKRQLRFTLTPEARAFGLTENALGRQLRAAGFGAEALRLLRDGNEVRVMVRLPEEERDSVQSLLDFVVRTPSGAEMSLNQAAEIENARAFTGIVREDGRRQIWVTAGVDAKTGGSPALIRSAIAQDVMPDLVAEYPGLTYDINAGWGGRRGRTEALMAIVGGVSGMVILIYALMASLFRNYIQGLIVVMTIPFSVTAAIAGHILMGFNLTSGSIFGMIALGGLVVNGALVLTTRFNALLRKGVEMEAALIEASKSRFRPIVLTSFTTTAGLLPLLFEKSVQAQFLIPMAIALSFGTVFSTFVVLFLTPVMHHAHQRFFGAGRRSKAAPQPAE